MLTHHTPAELIQIGTWTSAGGCLGLSAFAGLVCLGERLNGADLLFAVGIGSGLAMVLTSAVITWRKNA